jgi:hypothetical protein
MSMSILKFDRILGYRNKNNRVPDRDIITHLRKSTAENLIGSSLIGMTMAVSSVEELNTYFFFHASTATARIWKAARNKKK